MGQIEIFNHLLYLKSFNYAQMIINIELNYQYLLAILETI